MRRGDRLNAARRRVEQRLDQAWAIARHRFGPRAGVDSYDGDPRLAIVTVNRSTTRYLKLMLLTLAEQEELGILRRIVIVDNGSRDGGTAFLASLAVAVPQVELVEHHWFLNHARGMRSGIRALEGIERREPPRGRANILLFCDPDVIYRNPGTL